MQPVYYKTRQKVDSSQMRTMQKISKWPAKTSGLRHLSVYEFVIHSSAIKCMIKLGLGFAKIYKYT